MSRGLPLGTELACPGIVDLAGFGNDDAVRTACRVSREIATKNVGRDFFDRSRQGVAEAAAASRHPRDPVAPLESHGRHARFVDRLAIANDLETVARAIGAAIKAPRALDRAAETRAQRGGARKYLVFPY